MLTFATLFLGLVIGIHPVQLMVGGSAASVELYLDGTRIGAATEKPWIIDCDFGDRVMPHHLLAIARDAAGVEIDRSEQWINLPRAPVEGTLALEGFKDDRASFVRLIWSSVEDIGLEAVTVSFDGVPLAPDGSGRYPLPPYDPLRLHVITADLHFAGNVATRVEAALGGRWGADVTVEMTAVPFMAPPDATPTLASLAGRVRKRDRPLQLLAVDRGRADLVVVLETSALLGLGNHGRLLDRGGVFGDDFELQPDERLRFLGTTPRRELERSMPFDIFPISPAFGRGDDTLPHLLTHMRFDDGDRQQVADAVAVAAVQAAASNRPRAVVLVLGARWRDSSRFAIPEVRAFLEALRVPLVVWSAGPAPSRAISEDRRPLSVKTPWGKARDISTITRFMDALVQLRRVLGSQAVAWVEGGHLPQDITMDADSLSALADAEISAESVSDPPRESVVLIEHRPAATLTAPAAPPAVPAPIASPAASPAQLVARLNERRRELQRPPLRLSPDLSRAAQLQADRLTVTADLEWGLLDAVLGVEELEAAGYSAKRWVQAVANSPQGAERILETWRAQQPESYETFLDAGLEDLGIGVGRVHHSPLYSFVAAQSYESHYRNVVAELSDLEIVRQQVVDSINAERATAGLSPLRTQQQLDRAAQRYAERMRDESFYGHLAPDGTTVLERVRAAGYRPRTVGENLANGAESSDQAVRGWMGSEDHMKNIMSRRFTEIGIGVALGRGNGEYDLLWVLCFARPRR